jgi:hypothetical protein
MNLLTDETILYKTKLTKPQANRILKALAAKNKTVVTEEIGVNTQKYYYGLGKSNVMLDRIIRKNNKKTK